MRGEEARVRIGHAGRLACCGVPLPAKLRRSPLGLASSPFLGDKLPGLAKMFACKCGLLGCTHGHLYRRLVWQRSCQFLQSI